MRYRRSVLSAGLPTLREMDSMTRATQRTAISNPISDWLARAAAPYASQEVLWEIGGEAPEMPQKLRRLTVAHLLVRDDLASSLLSHG
jgi:hypothetical protein